MGLSGGVDSSVTAALLLEQGFEVIGVYMKNWNTESPTLGSNPLSEDTYRMECPWYDDYLDAKRVALHLGIPFYLWDFREAYKTKVFDAFLAEFKKGRTPNPDIYCNSLVKFDDFLKRAVEELGADFVATGHYARLTDSQNLEHPHPNPLPTKGEGITATPSPLRGEGRGEEGYVLQIPKDTKKDQTYFLYRLTQEQLAKTLFPLAEYTKTAVRQLAKQFNLPTKYKKDSMGICFVGDVSMREFISHWFKGKAGAIVDEQGKEIGRHEGVHYYTIGEKVAIDNERISKLYPQLKHAIPQFYVARKDIKTNTLVVVAGVDNPALYKREVVLEDICWINPKSDPSADGRNPKQITNSNEQNSTENSSLDIVSNFDIRASSLVVRLRHGGALVAVESIEEQANGLKISFAELQRAVTPGQHVVLYDRKNRVVGGGVIT